MDNPGNDNQLLELKNKYIYCRHRPLGEHIINKYKNLFKNRIKSNNKLSTVIPSSHKLFDSKRSSRMYRNVKQQKENIPMNPIEKKTTATVPKEKESVVENSSVRNKLILKPALDMKMILEDDTKENEDQEEDNDTSNDSFQSEISDLSDNPHEKNSSLCREGQSNNHDKSNDLSDADHFKDDISNDSFESGNTKLSDNPHEQNSLLSTKDHSNQDETYDISNNSFETVISKFSHNAHENNSPLSTKGHSNNQDESIDLLDVDQHEGIDISNNSFESGICKLSDDTLEKNNSLSTQRHSNNEEESNDQYEDNDTSNDSVESEINKLSDNSLENNTSLCTEGHSNNQDENNDLSDRDQYEDNDISNNSFETVISKLSDKPRKKNSLLSTQGHSNNNDDHNPTKINSKQYFKLMPMKLPSNCVVLDTRIPDKEDGFYFPIDLSTNHAKFSDEHSYPSTPRINKEPIVLDVDSHSDDMKDTSMENDYDNKDLRYKGSQEINSAASSLEIKNSEEKRKLKARILEKLEKRLEIQEIQKSFFYDCIDYIIEEVKKGTERYLENQKEPMVENVEVAETNKNKIKKSVRKNSPRGVRKTICKKKTAAKKALFVKKLKRKSPIVLCMNNSSDLISDITDTRLTTSKNSNNKICERVEQSTQTEKATIEKDSKWNGKSKNSQNSDHIISKYNYDNNELSTTLTNNVLDEENENSNLSDSTDVLCITMDDTQIPSSDDVGSIIPNLVKDRELKSSGDANYDKEMDFDSDLSIRFEDSQVSIIQSTYNQQMLNKN